ncbi:MULTISPECIES: hypothetical protein [unclassified Microcoleus]|uniref:hypothetical protein n=1 Tax=unclassified Microcoleus TaxID=2642155 RepID=UPI002FD5ECD6
MSRAIANFLKTLLKVDRTFPCPNQSPYLDIRTLRTAIIKIDKAAAGINTIIELYPAS